MEAGAWTQRPYAGRVRFSEWFDEFDAASDDAGAVRCVHGVLHVVAVRAHRARRDRDPRARARGVALPGARAAEGSRRAGVRRARALPDAGRRRVLDLRAPSPHVSHLRLPGVRGHGGRARRANRRSRRGCASGASTIDDRERWDALRAAVPPTGPPIERALRALAQFGVVTPYGIDVTAVFGAEQEPALEQQHALVVEQVLPPVGRRRARG